MIDPMTKICCSGDDDVVLVGERGRCLNLSSCLGKKEHVNLFVMLHNKSQRWPRKLLETERCTCCFAAGFEWFERQNCRRNVPEGVLKKEAKECWYGPLWKWMIGRVLPLQWMVLRQLQITVDVALLNSGRDVTDNREYT